MFSSLLTEVRAPHALNLLLDSSLFHYTGEESCCATSSLWTTVMIVPDAQKSAIVGIVLAAMDGSVVSRLTRLNVLPVAHPVCRVS